MTHMIFSGICNHCGEIKNISLNYHLRVYPNGKESNSLGKLQLYLALVSMPSILDNIQLLYQIYCPQLAVYWTSVAHHDHGDTEYIHLQSMSNNISLNDVQLLHGLDKKLDELIFMCTIDLVQVQVSGRNIGSGFGSNRHSRGGRYNPTYYFNAKQYIDNQLNVSPSPVINNGKTKESFRIKWNVDKGIINHLKQTKPDSNNTIISDIYYNMWSLKLDHRKVDRVITTNNNWSYSAFGSGSDSNNKNLYSVIIIIIIIIIIIAGAGQRHQV